MCDVLRKVWRLAESLLIIYHDCVFVICAMLWKWSSPHSQLCIVLINAFWKVLWESRRNKKFKRMYHFERSVSCQKQTTETIHRGTYHMIRYILLARDMSHTTMDAVIGMSDMGLRLRDNGCVSLGKSCITLLDISFHSIAYLYH